MEEIFPGADTSSSGTVNAASPLSNTTCSKCASLRSRMKCYSCSAASSSSQLQAPPLVFEAAARFAHLASQRVSTFEVAKPSERLTQITPVDEIASPSARLKFKAYFRHNTWNGRYLMWSWLAQSRTLVYCLAIILRELNPRHDRPPDRLIETVFGHFFYDLRFDAPLPNVLSTFRNRLFTFVIFFVLNLAILLGEFIIERRDWLDPYLYFGLYLVKVASWQILSHSIVTNMVKVSTSWKRIRNDYASSVAEAPLYLPDQRSLLESKMMDQHLRPEPSFGRWWKSKLIVLLLPVAFSIVPVLMYSRDVLKHRTAKDQSRFDRRVTPSNESGNLQCPDRTVESLEMQNSNGTMGRQSESEERSTTSQAGSSDLRGSAANSEHIAERSRGSPRAELRAVQEMNRGNTGLTEPCELTDEPSPGSRERSSDWTVLHVPTVAWESSWTVPRVCNDPVAHSTGVSEDLQPMQVMSGALRRSSDRQGEGSISSKDQMPAMKDDENG